MRTYIIDNGSQLTENLMEQCGKFEPEVIPYTAVNSATIPQDSLLILSGGSGKPIEYYPEEYTDELALIRNHPGPIVGICFGFELIAYAYGAKLNLSKDRHQGLVKITPTTPDTLFTNTASYSVYESHRWVVKKLVEPLMPLAESENGVEILKHRSKQIYGFQFHPESPNDVDGKQLLHRMLDQLV